MPITKATYSTQEAADKFVLESPMANLAISALYFAGNEGLTTTQLKDKLGHGGLGSASSLMKVFLTARIVTKAPKQAVLQPYVLNLVGLFDLWKRFTLKTYENTLLGDEKIADWFMNQPEFSENLKKQFELALKEKSPENLTLRLQNGMITALAETGFNPAVMQRMLDQFEGGGLK